MASNALKTETVHGFTNKQYGYQIYQQHFISILRELYPKYFNEKNYDNTIIQLILQYEYLDENDHYLYWCKYNMPTIIDCIYPYSRLIFIKCSYLISNLFFIIVLSLYLYIWFIHCNQNDELQNVIATNNTNKLDYEQIYFKWFDIGERFNIIDLKYNSEDNRDYNPSISLYLIHCLSYLLIESTPKTYNNIYHSKYNICYIIIIWYLFEIFKNAYFCKVNRNISRILIKKKIPKINTKTIVSLSQLQTILSVWIYGNTFMPFTHFIPIKIICFISFM